MKLTKEENGAIRAARRWHKIEPTAREVVIINRLVKMGEPIPYTAIGFACGFLAALRSKRRKAQPKGKR